MTDICRFFRLPLGFNELSGANNPMIGLLGAASLGLSVGSSLFGGLKSRKAAKREHWPSRNIARMRRRLGMTRSTILPTWTQRLVRT